MTYARPVLLFYAMLIGSFSIAQQKQNNKKQVKPKQLATVKPEPTHHFNVAEFSEKRTPVREQYHVPGTDSVVTETYYVWLLPK